MKVDLRSLTRDFMINEGKGPTMNSWIQALSEDIASLKPHTMAEERRIEIMKHNLAELRRVARRMQNRIVTLEEEVNFLQESNND